MKSIDLLVPIGLIAIVTLVASWPSDADDFLTISNCGHPAPDGDKGEIRVQCQVTSHASEVIRYAILGAALIEPGRAIPWAKERSLREFAGGLMPGETRTVSLEVPDVTRLPYGEDSALTFEVINVSGAGAAFKNRLYP